MPGTNFEFALKRCSVMVCIVVRVFSFVMIVNTDDRSGKSGDFTESYKDGFVNLALRSKQRPEVKQSDARKCQDGCDDKLYVTFVCHKIKKYLFPGYRCFFRLTVQNYNKKTNPPKKWARNDISISNKYIKTDFSPTDSPRYSFQRMLFHRVIAIRLRTCYADSWSGAAVRGSVGVVSNSKARCGMRCRVGGSSSVVAVGPEGGRAVFCG